MPTIQTHHPEHDPWMTDPADRDYLPPLERWCRRCARPDAEHEHRRYRLTVNLGFGLPTVTRHELAPTADAARALYETRTRERYGELGTVVLVEDLGPLERDARAAA